MSFHFIKFGYGYMNLATLNIFKTILPNSFDSFSPTAAEHGMFATRINPTITVNVPLTPENIQYVTSLGPYSDSNDILTFQYSNLNTFTYTKLNAL